MQTVARLLSAGVCAASLALAVGPRPAPAQAGSPVGDGTPGSCDYSAFATAFAAGGYISFNCGPNPHTIVLEADGGLQTLPLQHTTVDGDGLITFSAANEPGRRLFYVNGSYLTLTQVSLVNAIMDGPGGAIYNINGRLILDEVRIDHTGVTGANTGGAIYSFGWLEVYDSTFEHNDASLGGAIYNVAGARVWINGSTFFSNTVGNGEYGGAIYNAGQLTVTASTFVRNTQYLSSDCPVELNSICGGGAISNVSGGRLVISETVFSGNASGDYGGALLNKGHMTLMASTLRENEAEFIGGAVVNVISATALLTEVVISRNQATHVAGMFNAVGSLAHLKDVTIEGNTAQGDGGGFTNESEVRFDGVTISGNSAEVGGGFSNYGGMASLYHTTISGNEGSEAGGIYNAGYLSMAYVTLFGNRSSQETFPGGIHNVTSFDTFLYLYHVLLADNAPYNCEGEPPNSATTNLSTDDTCFAAGPGGNVIDASQQLGPLANNGGPTLTHMIAAGSSAHDPGSCLGGFPLDQRGLPRSVGSGCDIGAVERQDGDFGWYVFLPFTQR
jgi:hypothetical protein